MLSTLLLLGALSSGPFAVGFEQHAGDLPMSVWYPAAATRHPHMRFRDYTSDAGNELTRFLASTGMNAETITAFLDHDMRAVRDARRLRRRFPLILIAHGNSHDAADQAFLAEYLASHGYIVASVPSPMLKSPMTTVDEIAKFAEQQAADLGAALTRLDARDAVIVSHSFGARAGLLLAMRDERVRGIVSLDGGIGTAIGADQLRTAPSFDARRTPPILHLYGDVDPFMKADFAFLDALDAPFVRKEKLSGVRHAHFTSIGFASAAIPELGRITKAPPDIDDSLRRIAAETLAFARRYGH